MSLARRDLRLPPATAGQRIGLVGGSFNPAHAAHRAASLLALKRCRLDRVWWLVTPGNPLKDNRALPPLEERIAVARRVADDTRIVVTGFEAAFGLSYSADTLAFLTARRPGVRFVWIMGADNLASFHRWRNWRQIAATVPLAVVDRMGDSLAALASPAGRALARHRLPEEAAGRLAQARPPAFVFLHGLKSALSSTRIRHEAARLAAAQQETGGGKP